MHSSLKRKIKTNELKIYKARSRRRDFEKNRNIQRQYRRYKGEKRKPNSYINYRFRVETISFPQDSTYIGNFNSFNQFINKILAKINSKTQNKIRKINFDLSRVELIDSAAINVILTMVNYLGRQGIRVSGNLPDNESAKNILINSGFFTKVKTTQEFARPSDRIFNLSGDDQTNEEAIGAEIRIICKRLLGYERTYSPLYNTLGEIAGNSVEHANTDLSNKNWFMSVHYEDDKAIIQMADIGKGILKTLNLLLKQEVLRVLRHSLPHEILKKLFMGTYQSSTREKNRNNGLPDMLARYNNKFINNVIVVSNNAVYDFSGNLSTTLNHSFHGTFYSIEITKENITKWLDRLK